MYLNLNETAWIMCVSDAIFDDFELKTVFNLENCLFSEKLLFSQQGWNTTPCEKP